MPCFKGLAVSIHTPDGPLSEHSIQKQSRVSRITSYIPVPPAKVPEDSVTNRPEQSTFAISITLLTPGMNLPYSSPKATTEDPYPRPKQVGSLPGQEGGRGSYSSAVGPYIPLTSSPNETIAAYIYFDGRQKEEVATLLRRGEETWVNSRWVSVPDSEGGGLAEREFLFREVGLERWLNGLDLDGKDAAATIERRRQKMERRRRRRKEAKGSGDEGDMDIGEDKKKGPKGILRYGDNESSPVEQMSDDDLGFSTSSDSDLDPPPPEAAGQIKVALFRVLASGEIKRGEYSPQFDAHDDDEGSEAGRGEENGEATTTNEADVDHTTSFAKPKTLDPKTISTQTVTGIDGPEKPYATFTFLYRGRSKNFSSSNRNLKFEANFMAEQLHKMGILSNQTPQAQPTSTAAKRRSIPTDFSKLGPLKTTGTVGFTAFRDNKRQSGRRSKKRNGKMVDIDSGDDADSDEDERDIIKSKEDDKDEKEEAGKTFLDPEDARRGELAEGVRKIKVRDSSLSTPNTIDLLITLQLKRAHSAEPGKEDAPRKSPNSMTPIDGNTPPPSARGRSSPPAQPGDKSGPTSAAPAGSVGDGQTIGSPLKKQRPSIAGLDDPEALRKRFGLLSGSSSSNSEAFFGPPLTQPKKAEDEDL
ncbi:MAG: hypothetical protein M1814_005349 [Vezdaea aestivalis]|nr:MAG: hypothetical protein M1814_005349 [Vezdaea aestivalis]